MAIKSFDKSKLRSVGMLEQSTVQGADTGCSGEFVEDDDSTAPPRSKFLQRRHTVTVALPAEQGGDSGSGSPAEPGLPQCQDWDDSVSDHWQGSWGSRWCEFQSPFAVCQMSVTFTAQLRAGTGSAAQLECSGTLGTDSSAPAGGEHTATPLLISPTRWRQQNSFPIIFSTY